MQSSYNVIKNISVKSTGPREIVTTAADVGVVKAEAEENAKNHIESYENLARTIVESARRQADQIKMRAFEDARLIEEEALIKAEQLRIEAYDSGFQQGFNEAYPQAIAQAKAEGEVIIASAEEILSNVKAEYESYLLQKEKDIKNLILNIAKTVLKKEVQDADTVTNMIYEALEESQSSHNFIIRCSSIYVEHLKERISSWKEQLGFLGDIFVVVDNSLEPGNAVIDKGNGKIVVGIDYALQRIEEILMEKE